MDKSKIVQGTLHCLKILKANAENHQDAIDLLSEYQQVLYAASVEATKKNEEYQKKREALDEERRNRAQNQ